MHRGYQPVWTFHVVLLPEEHGAGVDAKDELEVGNW